MSPSSATSLRPSGHLCDTTATASDCTWSMWMHLAPFVGFFVLGPFALLAPLVMWSIRKDQSPFADDHGREIVNMEISGAIVLGIGMVTGIGLLFWAIWIVVAFIGLIRGATAASNGEYFRYPMTVRLLN